jgi:hypothetical protein
MPTDAADCDFPFKGTEATKMLKAGLERAANERGLSTRAAARELGYKATVVISHMATGRVPIPLDRAVEIAEVVGIDSRKFFIAVLEQRHPGSTQFLRLSGQGASSSDHFATELELLAGSPLDKLAEEHKRVLREVVADKAPKRRWLSLAELPTVMRLRELRPDFAERGLPKEDLAGIETFLEIATGE